MRDFVRDNVRFCLKDL